MSYVKTTLLSLVTFLLIAAQIKPVNSDQWLGTVEPLIGDRGEAIEQVPYDLQTIESSLSAPPTSVAINSANSLSRLVNQYRSERGLSAIPISPSLTRVAQAHVRDLENNNPSGRCNLHSWSNQGNWTACCYTSDHARAECMWNKPEEITGGLYRGNGYEISASYGGRMTARRALDIWKGSTPHHNVIINRGIWADDTWQAMGSAMSEHYAVVWFGKEIDPAR